MAPLHRSPFGEPATNSSTQNEGHTGVELPARFALPLDTELTGHLLWVTTLRWFVALLVVLSGLWCTIFDVGVPGPTIMVVGVVIALYNIVILLVVQPRLNSYIINANIQISFDWVSLLVLLHLTGGLHSPAVYFFVFHVLLAAFLIPGFGCYIHALVAAVLVGSVGYLEYTGIIEHIVPIWADSSPPGGYNLLVLVGSVSIGTLLAAFFVSTIVAHLRQAEQEQANLHHELAEAIEHLDKANQELIALDEEKSRYTRMVTHQLRSPLSAIQSMLRVLLDGYTGSIDAKVVEVIGRAEKRTVKLLDTVSDLLNLAELKFQPRNLNEEPIAVEPVVAGLILKYEPTAQVRQVTIEGIIPEELTIKARAEDIERPLDNLINNAVKYSLPGGHVRIRGWADSKQVHISVEDSGIGIPREAQAQLFQEFYRSPNAKLFEPIGTGLGLVIVKRSVERWDGSVTFRSDVEQGTTFTVHFPLPQST